MNRCVHRAIVLVYQPDVPIHTTETEHTSLIGVTVSEEVQNKHRFMKGWAVHPKKGTGMGRNTSSNYEDVIRDCVLKGGNDDAAKMSAAMILEYIQHAYPRRYDIPTEYHVRTKMAALIKSLPSKNAQITERRTRICRKAIRKDVPTTTAINGQDNLGQLNIRSTVGLSDIPVYNNNITATQVGIVIPSQSNDGSAHLYMGDICGNEEDVTTDVIGNTEVNNNMTLDGSTCGTVGGVGAVSHRRRLRRMTKKYSQLLEGIVKSNTSIKDSEGCDVLKLELRLHAGSILPDDFPSEEAIRRKIKNIKRSMNLQAID